MLLLPSEETSDDVNGMTLQEPALFFSNRQQLFNVIFGTIIQSGGTVLKISVCFSYSRVFQHISLLASLATYEKF